jgi:uncharacterized protein (DUF433 family)
MGTIDRAQTLLAGLDKAEKAQVLRDLVDELGDHPGIESTPGICGGDACILRTRIPVWVLEQARRCGTSEAELLESFPTLRAADLVSAWAYVRSHQDEIDRAIQDNEAA